MKRTAPDYFCCLHCGGDIALARVDNEAEIAGSNEVLEGQLRCVKCSHTYPIRGGVPRFVDQTLTKQQDIETGERFADSWFKFSRMAAMYWSQMFDGWAAPVCPEFIKDKVVLELGCGKGRHTEIMNRAGAKQIFSLDIGNQVELAFRNVGHLPSVNILQADIANMPVKPEFDFTFSLGVVHHMDNPRDGFVAQVSKLKPDGSTLCWVYGRENNGWVVHVLNPIRIHMTSRMPAPLLSFVSWMLTLPLFVISKTLNGPWCALQRAIPALPDLYYQDYLVWIGGLDFTEMFNIVFDHLVAPVAFYHHQDELREWCQATGLKKPFFRWHNKNSWTIFATKQNRDPLELLEEAKAKQGRPLTTAGR